MNVTGSHVAGGGFGAIVGVGLAALGKKINLELTTAEAASFGIAVTSVGVAVGHALGKAWGGPGIFPALHRGLFGAKAAK